jgi:uncharacterized protein YdiU (UPF0061 family)
MHAAEADFTLTFRQLAAVASGQTPAIAGFHPDFAPWIAEWQARLAREPAVSLANGTGSFSDRAALLLDANPLFIPRNHRVEEAIRAAEDHDDFGPFGLLLEVVTNPWDYVEQRNEYCRPALPSERVARTFCGT